MIRFDFSGTSSTLIGEHGLALKELSALTQAGKDAHSHILNARGMETVGFYELPRRPELLDEIKQTAAQLQGRFKNIVNLGVGGSALGAKALCAALTDPLHNLFSEPRLFFLDSADPEATASLLARLDARQSLFIVTSKSGATPETLAQFLVVLKLLKDCLGKAWREHLIFVTDPEEGALRALAQSENIRALSIPATVGGRFSVLSPAGLLPAALVGIDIEAVLAGAARMNSVCLERGIFSNPAYMYGAIHYLYLKQGVNISILMPYADALGELADWYAHLWAETLGKQASLDGARLNTGQTPLKALGTTAQHSLLQLLIEGPYDKLVNLITIQNYRQDVTIPRLLNASPEFAYLGGQSLSDVIKAGARATATALIQHERPAISIELETIDPASLGALLVFFEAAAAFTGFLLIVNPFDQPGAELGKQLMFGSLGRAGYADQSSVPPSLNDLWFEV